MIFTSRRASDSLGTNSYTEKVPAHRRARGPCSTHTGRVCDYLHHPPGAGRRGRAGPGAAGVGSPRPLIKTLCSSQRAAFTVPSAHWLPLASQPLFTLLPGSEHVLLSLLGQGRSPGTLSEPCGSPPALSTTSSPGGRLLPTTQPLLSGFFLGALGLPWDLSHALSVKYTLTLFLKFRFPCRARLCVCECVRVVKAMMVEPFQSHSKIEWKVQRVPLYSQPMSLQHPHSPHCPQRGTSMTPHEPTGTRHRHRPTCVVFLGFALGVVRSGSWGKCPRTALHH